MEVKVRLSLSRGDPGRNGSADRRRMLMFFMVLFPRFQMTLSFSLERIRKVVPQECSLKSKAPGSCRKMEGVVGPERHLFPEVPHLGKR